MERPAGNSHSGFIGVTTKISKHACFSSSVKGKSLNTFIAPCLLQCDTMIYDNLRIVAAGRGRSMNMPPIMNAVLDLVPRKQQSDINMVYLGTASYDKSDVFHAQTSEYQKIANCRLTKLDVSEAVEQIPSEYVIRSMLLSADVIMVSGGNTLYAMNRWKELKIDAIIKEAVDSSSPVLCGGSAGAICWFQYGHSDSMDPTTFLQVDPNLTKEQKEGWEYIWYVPVGFM